MLFIDKFQEWITGWQRQYAIKPVIDIYTDEKLIKVGDTYSNPFSTRGFNKGLLQLRVTAVSGSSPTLIPAIETSEDGHNWFHNAILIDKTREGDLTRLTAPTDEAKITTTGYYVQWLGELSNYFRLKHTVGGTTPTFTITEKVTLYA